MPRERGGKAYERAVEARGAIRAAQAGANDHDAPNPGPVHGITEAIRRKFDDDVSI